MKKRILQIIVCLFIVAFLASCAQHKKRCPAYGYHQATVEHTV